MEALETYGSFQLSPQTYFKNALLLFENQQLSSALQAIDAAIVFSNNSPFYIYQKIRILYNLGDYRSCSQLIVSQLAYLYKHSSLYILCRILDYLQKMNHYTLGDLKKLLGYHHVPYCLADSYKTLLTQKDKPFLLLAKKAMVQDDYTLCLCYCQLYCKLHPVTPDIMYMKAYSYHILCDLIQARTNYIAYLKAQPNNTLAYIHVSFISMELGDYEVATDYLQKASDMEPSNKQYLFYLGECYYNAKKYEQAITTYEAIAKLEPDNLQNCFNLFHAYQKINKRRLSRHYLKRIQKHLKKGVSTNSKKGFSACKIHQLLMILFLLKNS